MDKDRIIHFDNSLNSLKEVISEGFLLMMFEACIVALDSQKHNSGVQMSAHKHSENVLGSSATLLWEKTITNLMIASHRDLERTTDFGAMFLSMVLLKSKEAIGKLSKDEIAFETSAKGSGVDFWISRKSDKLNFLARLEISGIRKASPTNTFENRLNRKKQQVEKSNGTNLPVFISIVEFGKPALLLTFNNYEEQTS